MNGKVSSSDIVHVPPIACEILENYVLIMSNEVAMSCRSYVIFVPPGSTCVALRIGGARPRRWCCQSKFPETLDLPPSILIQILPL